MNPPRFYPNASWDSDATTFVNESIVGQNPFDIFIDSNNSICIPNRQTGQIHIWLNQSSVNPTKTISSGLSDLRSIFVTTNGDIYVGDGGTNRRVDKWIAQNETWIPVVSFQSFCADLFIDIYESLYCSLVTNHRIDKQLSNGKTIIVAGTDVRGSSLEMLDSPWGIYVDINLDLYVADSLNHRIQLFRLSQRNGITVAGKGSSAVTIELLYPTGIILDGDQYLFIVDSHNNRIVGSNEYGFHCIFGCFDQSSTNNKLSNPLSMSFDSYGNIFFTDTANHRIQKLHLSKKSYRKCDIL